MQYDDDAALPYLRRLEDETRLLEAILEVNAETGVSLEGALEPAVRRLWGDPETLSDYYRDVVARVTQRNKQTRLN